MRRRHTLITLALAAGGSLLLAAPAAAHGLVGKQDLPIPRWLFAWAAAIVLVVSFIGLAVLWPTPRLQQLRERTLARLPGVLSLLCGTIGVLLFAGLVYAGLAGAQAEETNILPTTVYVAFWVGIPFASFLFGDVFRAFNPWLAVARAVEPGMRWLFGGRVPPAMRYPDRLGHWPAAIGLLAFAWLELVYVQKGDPATLAALALAYAAIQWIGMSLYGVQTWSERGDAFGVYFGLFARISPLRWGDGRLWARLPLAGLPSMPVYAGTVPLLAVMIGSTSFDGLSQGNVWTSIAPWLQDRARSVGIDGNASLEVAFTIGLLAVVILVYGLYRAGIAGVRTVDRKRGSDELAGLFVHTLVPIALAYVIAHYFGLLSYQGQAMVYLLSDPLGDGSDVFGTAGTIIDYNWISATGIWYVQVGALVVGHVAGLTLAHDRAIAIYQNARQAVRSQYWMLAVMVAFTSIALWLLSATG